MAGGGDRALGAGMITIGLADDDPLFIAGLSMILDA
jgi:hypothetical protein